MKQILNTAFALFFVFILGACGEKNVDIKPTTEEKFEIPQDMRSFEIDKSTATLEVTATTNLAIGDWKVDQGSCNWIITTKKSISSTKAGLTLSVKANTDPAKRTASININGKSGNTLATITVTQYGDQSLKVDEDVQVTPTSGNASENQPGYGIEKTFDGKKDNGHYHSRWGKATQFPVTLEYFFPGDKPIDYIIYYPRTDGGHNGHIGEFTLYAATDAAHNYKKIGDFNFGMKSAPSMADIPGNLKPTAIKFEVKTGQGDGEGSFVSCSEMEFYGYATERPVEDRLKTVFTDLTCTELKPGVTDEMIENLDEFFMRTAKALKNNSYDAYEKEFRVRSYEPYSKNSEWADKLMTKRYSDLDNPTGICVNKGDEVVVCVGDTHGQTVSLQSIWEEKTGGDSPYMQTQASGVTYFLREGINKLTMQEQGQLFVMYNTDLTSANAKPIKIHIPLGSGKVTGFFDLKEHKSDEKYAELLKKATHKYFCVRGERIMFYFHRMKLTPTILSAINLWDDIIGWQQELMGIDDVRPSKFNNHIFAISPEGSYMWASDYRVAFVYTYLDNILLKNNVMAAEDNAWGPAHEIGHIHQKAINWATSTESSNNLFSNYIIYKLGKYKSRGRGLEAVATARYENGQGWSNMGDATHMNEDTETHLRMNWQLWNYYHRLGIKPDFWQTLFKSMRELGMNETSDPGRKMIEFAKRASKAANEDLTDFFEMWGFFVPVDATIEQYGTYKFKVTADMIAEAKSYMAQFPKPKHALQYIEDRYASDFPSSDARSRNVGDLGHYSVFKDNKKVDSGASATYSNRKVTTTGTDNAVAIEIRRGNKDGEIVYFSNFKEFTIPSKVNATGCCVCAVQADGTRILLKNI